MKRVIETLEIAKKAQAKDCDSVFIVVGRERSGKSHFTLNCDDYLNASIDGIIVDKNKLGEGLNKLSDSDVFHFDEAADGLFSKDSMNKFNKELEKLFMIIGAKKLISFILIPDFFLLSPYFRKHRVVGLFWVYKRGRVAFYDRNGIKKINFNHDKYKTSDIKGGRPLYYDTFPMYRGKLIKPYNDKKRDKVNSMINVFSEATKAPPKVERGTKKETVIKLLKAGWQPKQIAKEVNCSYAYVRDIAAVNS